MERGMESEIESPKDLDEESEWREDVCVICFEKCFALDSTHFTNSSGKIETVNLLSLLDTSMDDGPEVVTVCVTCALMIGRLQGFQEELARIQSSFKSAREEIVSKILNSESNSDKTLPAYSNVVNSTLRSRWKGNERVLQKEESDDSLTDFHSKIPRDLIISPASPTFEDLSDEERVEQEERSPQKKEHHEIQFHLDPKDFEDADIKFNGSDSNESRDVECIQVEDSEDEEEIDTATLIPAIEISTFSESEQGSTEFSMNHWDAIEGDLTNPLPEDLKDVISQSSGEISHQQFFYSNGDGFNSNGVNRLYSEPVPPVGLPALSPVYNMEENSRTKVPKRIRAPTKAKSNPRNPIFSCTVCTETFTSRERFKEHLEIHNGKAPTCVLCQKVFPRKHNLMIHMRTHTGEKPYDCPVCHKPYSDRSNFNAHVRKHMAKPFACTICGRMFDKSQAAHVHATSMHPEEAAGKIISKVTFKS